jgi:hypothetical protein
MKIFRLPALAASLALVGAAPAHVPITAFPNFTNACYGYALPGNDTWGDFSCPSMPAGFIGFSVTQETPSGDHIGSLNWIGPDHDYMADYTFPTDLGDWLDMGADGGVVSLSEDTANFAAATNSQTGWPVPYGHTFVGLNDLSIVNASLNNDINVEFDVLVQRRLAPAKWHDFTGVRVILGGVVNWREPSGRANRDHYFEVDLSQTDGYAASLGDLGLPLCDDAPYDYCFYDPTGQYPEGRYVSYDDYLQNDPVPLGTWTHIAVPYGAIVKSLGWVDPPADWSKAHIGGLYVAIEGIGTHQTSLQVRNWNPYSLAPASSRGLPAKATRKAAPQLVRIGQGAYLRASRWYCVIGDQPLAAFGFGQDQYDAALQIYPPALGLAFTGDCRA